MKQTMKKLVTFCLAVVMIITLLPAVPTKAATKTENLTLYVGEAIYVTNYYDVTKVTSSNKKVATVSSKGAVKGIKAGKAVITVSANGVSKKVTITVKK